MRTQGEQAAIAKRYVRVKSLLIALPTQDMLDRQAFTVGVLVSPIKEGAVSRRHGSSVVLGLIVLAGAGCGGGGATTGGGTDTVQSSATAASPTVTKSEYNAAADRLCRHGTVTAGPIVAALNRDMAALAGARPLPTLCVPTRSRSPATSTRS